MIFRDVTTRRYRAYHDDVDSFDSFDWLIDSFDSFIHSKLRSENVMYSLYVYSNLMEVHEWL